MSVLRVLFAAAILLLMPAAAAAGGSDRVVVSIKPIHSLVSAVMSGVGEPYLLVDGSRSPHDFSLKPSDAQALERAAIVFWVGPELERFLEKSIETLAGDASIVALADAPGLIRLGFREGGPFEAHEDEHDEHEDHDDVSEDDDGHGHHGRFDMHLWLDPENARAMVRNIADVLKAADPDNARMFEANALALGAKLESLVGEVKAELAPVAGRPFIVFHDAYQYFEKRFALTAVGSITVIPDVMPGAARLREIHDKVKELGAACVFAEPQFDPKLVGVVASGAEIKTGVLDPLGANLDDGPGLYFQLVRDISKSVLDCLS